jgi:hypothetical protein
MFSNLIALCLLAMPVVAVWSAARAWSPPVRDLWLKVWPTAWFPALWLFGWLPIIGVQANPPFEYSLFAFWLPLLSWVSVALFCRLGMTRRLGLGSIFALLVLIVFSLALLPPDQIAASRDWKARRVFPSVRSRLLSLAGEAPEEEPPAGWVDREPIASRCRINELSGWVDLKARHFHLRQWHTWLTGLYRVESHPAGVWYPGGKPAEAASRLEWRPR